MPITFGILFILSSCSSTISHAVKWTNWKCPSEPICVLEEPGWSNTDPFDGISFFTGSKMNVHLGLATSGSFKIVFPIVDLLPSLALDACLLPIDYLQSKAIQSYCPTSRCMPTSREFGHHDHHRDMVIEPPYSSLYYSYSSSSDEKMSSSSSGTALSSSSSQIK